MKRDHAGTVLVLALAISTAATAAICYQYLKASRDFRFLQAQTVKINQKRAGMQALAIDLNDYARRNPALEPLLEKLNIRLRPTTNAASGPRP